MTPLQGPTPMPEPTSPPVAAADREILAVGSRLAEIKAALGADYWRNGEVQALQQQLRRLIGSYNAWTEDGLPMHQRARRAARWESEFAPLLWPGRG